MDWSESTSAAALAVATIVIPGVDAFFGSNKVEQWYDRVSDLPLPPDIEGLVTYTPRAYFCRCHQSVLRSC